jgi:2-oxoisovalerate dehydrogenase E1 component
MPAQKGRVLSARNEPMGLSARASEPPTEAAGGVVSAGPTLLKRSPRKIRLDEAHYPAKLPREVFYPVAYRSMYLSRRMEEQLFELFQKGYVRGTVTISIGNEATAVGMALPFRPRQDVVSLLHRDFAAHLLWGSSPYQLVCQYMANADSPTHGREGNVHHGDASSRRFPMMSHLGKMLSLVVGGTWAARQNQEKVFGLAVIGDGGSSTGEFHEALNLASVFKVPVLFLVENNGYSFSTPTEFQYNCERLSDRARGYGIAGRTIDGTDVWEVYSSVWNTLDRMQEEPAPVILECMSIRLHGHAAYDKAEYVTPEQREANLRRDPLPRTRQALQEYGALTEAEISQLEQAVDDEIQQATARALKVGHSRPPVSGWTALAPPRNPKVKPFQAKRVKNGRAINLALETVLTDNPRAFLAGLDVGPYGSAFKTCKGLFDRFGRDRVIDMPLCESGVVGFALGASQVGARPIVEFQFADFSTEVASQLGLNAGTWYFRSGSPAPILLRLPCGGGLTMGAFHSGEFEGLWSRFPGLKLLYPATPQECYEAILAGFHDPNPCLVFEHKLLYWSRSEDIDFDGNLESVWRSRRYTDGPDLTLVATGSMVFEARAAASKSGRGVEVWNPFVLQPLDIAPIMQSVDKTGRLLVVQECGEARGPGDQIISLVARQCLSGLKCPPKLISAPDVPVPFAPELESDYRPNADKILAGIEEMLAK